MVATNHELGSQTRRHTQAQHRNSRSRIPQIAPIATSSEEARQEYEVVEEAYLALQPDTTYNLTFPPLYGAESGPWDTTIIANTDDDEWLTLGADAWTLEHILQAEQVIDMLIKVKEWAMREESTTWMPSLAQLALLIDEDNLLPSLRDEISGIVEIVRVRSLTDPSGKSVSLRRHSWPVVQEDAFTHIFLHGFLISDILISDQGR
jgi:hypothetical protein